MKPYSELTKNELTELRAVLKQQYKKIQAKDLKLNMSRGVPCMEQLDLSLAMMDVLGSDADMISESGADCRNYGVLDGIPEAKMLLADMMEIPPENIIIFGNSSLNVMYDTVARSYTHGVMGSTPWCKLDKVKFLCIVPGYDRHFAITKHFGIENVPVPMLEDGPDMDMIEDLVQNDPTVKGVWCTPKYSNPTGNTYSDECVRRFARLKPAAQDFRLYWDNAYTVHHLYDDPQDYIIEIMGECKRMGHADMVYKFASTSKITFPGSGIAAIGASLNNLEDIKNTLKYQTIGFDKLNQLRHVRFFGDIHGVVEHMEKHAAILRPKFELVEQILEEELGDLGIATWTKPHGGYFISYNTLDGCAKTVVNRCKKAGVTLTPAGATYPDGNDPHDSNIRLAPSSPSMEDLETATRLLCLSTKIASVDYYLAGYEKTGA